MNLPKLIYLIASDPAFLSLSQENCEKAASIYGLSLEQHQITAISSLVKKPELIEKLLKGFDSIPEQMPYWAIIELTTDISSEPI